MESGSLWKKLALVFLGALAVYILAFWSIERRRSQKGPWQVTFDRTEMGHPILRIDQPQLGIQSFDLTVTHTHIPPGDFPQMLTFGNPPRATPYQAPIGQVIFLDTTFLPGTVTLLVAGHEIELLPRTLIVDKKEISWDERPRVEITEPAPENLQIGPPPQSKD